MSKLQLQTVETMKVSNGTVKVDDAVSAQSKEGHITEGQVYLLQPWGQEWFDKEWTDGTVIIKDHEDGTYCYWNPKNVTKL